MALYEYANDAGEITTESFPMGEAPSAIQIGATVYRRRFSPFNNGTKMIHRASGHVEIDCARAMFEEPNPANPGGVSDAQRVRDGKAKTKACSTWV
jgi:hypothetical protein